MAAAEELNLSLDESQICEFKIGNDYFGVSVLNVQEIIKPQKITRVPLSEPYVKGLINLRGQIVTALSLRELFGLEGNYSEDYMNVIVRHEGQLVSLMVDKICDVRDLETISFQDTPDTLSDKILKYVDGVFKLDDRLLIVLNVNKIINLNNKGND